MRGPGVYQDGTTREEVERTEANQELPAHAGGQPAAAGRGDAGAVQEEEAADHLPLRLVAVAGAGVGRAERDAGAGGVAPRPDQGGGGAAGAAHVPAPAGVQGAGRHGARDGARPPGRGGAARRPGGAVPELGGQGGAALLRRAARCRCSSTSGSPPRPSSKRSRATSATSGSIPTRPVRRPAALDRRPGAARLRVPRQVGQPHDPRRLAGGDELAARTTRASAGRCR